MKNILKSSFKSYNINIQKEFMLQYEDIYSSIQSIINEYFLIHAHFKIVSGLYKAIIKEVERALITNVMSITNNNKKLSAKILGISRNTLSAKIKFLES